MSAPTALITRSGSSDATKSEAKIETFTGEDLWASIGAAQDQREFAQRTLALSDPKAYEAARSLALANLKTAAAATFTSTYKMYDTAGYGETESKKLAIAASKQTYDTGIRALRASFPSATDSVYQGAKTKRSVLLASSASRSAPKTKKKKASKRR